jgi:transposase
MNASKSLKKEIRDLINQNPGLKSQQDLLTSIPGIAELTAGNLLAEVGDFSAFENATQLAAYAGLSPISHRSGSSISRKTRVLKHGRSELRRCHYLPVVVSLSWNPVIQTLAERMK